MIWTWILISLCVSLLLLKGKNIAPYNLIWIFLPIDKYGVTFAGFTIKPVYIFSLIIVAYAIAKGKFRFKLPRISVTAMFIFLILIVASFLFRTDFSYISDISTYGMFFFTAVCAALSLSLIEGEKDVGQIHDVMIAAAVGYGIVFVVLFTLYEFGIVLPDVIAYDKSDNSVLRIFANPSNGVLYETVRLRGFHLDPKASTITFCLGLASLLGKWIKEGGVVKNLIFTFIIIYTLYLTGSRTAIISAFALIFISLFRFFFGRAKSHKKVVFLSICGCIVFVGLFIVVYRREGVADFIDGLLEGYGNRSGVNDRYGRFTIWREATTTLFENNWFAGLGMGKISQLISSERHAHNTFIEILCASGVFVCAFYIVLFISPVFNTIRNIRKHKKFAFDFASFLLGYISIIVLVTSVSYIASTYLIYVAFLLYTLPGCLEDESARSPALPEL